MQFTSTDFLVLVLAIAGLLACAGGFHCANELKKARKEIERLKQALNHD